MKSEILIIGGGVIGLSIARALHKQGAKSIAIIERGSIGREASFAAAGMLAVQAETNEQDAFYYLCSKSRDLYPAFADELYDETGIDIELERTGTLYLAFTESDSREISERYEWQKKAGLPVERLSAEDLRKSEPFISPDVLEGLFFANDWQVENRKLLSALEEYARRNGIEIRNNTEVKRLLIENGKITGAETDGEIIRAEKMILATGAWTSLIKLAGLDFDLPSVTPIRGQMVSFRTLRRMFFHVVFSPRGYIVPRLDGKILAGATVEYAGFENRVTEEGIELLKQNAFEISPSLEKIGVEDSWSGLRPYASDGIPVIGDFKEIENLFIATAHFRNGVLLAPVTANMIAEKILKPKDSAYKDAFGPDRFKAATASGTAK